MVLINDTRVDLHHGCTLVVQALHQLAADSGMKIIATAPAHQNWAKNANFMAALHNADGIIVNGEGTIHHNRVAGKWLLQAAAKGRELGKPTLLCNATWDANGAQFGALAQMFNLVAVRETGSQQQLAAKGVTAVVAPDAALLFDWPQAATRRGISLTDSVNDTSTRQLQPLARRLAARRIDIHHGPVSRLQNCRRMLDRRHPLQISNLSEALRAACFGLGERLNAPQDFIAGIAGSELLITGRFHAVILAMATRTPFLAVCSNTHKIESTIADAGLEPWRCVSSVAEITPQLVQRATQWHSNEVANLEVFIQSGRAAISAVFPQFRGLMT